MMIVRIALLIPLLGLTACTTPPAAPPAAGTIPERLEVPAAPAQAENRQLEFKLASGTYRCDMGLRVEVQRAADTPNQIQIGWTGKRYQLARNPSHSGLPRFEDSRSGLVWIDLPWKSMLLDAQTSKPLASECKLG